MVFAIIGNAIGVHCITDNVICISCRTEKKMLAPSLKVNAALVY
jgi:hypothetical protein